MNMRVSLKPEFIIDPYNHIISSFFSQSLSKKINNQRKKIGIRHKGENSSKSPPQLSWNHITILYLS